MLKCWLFFSTKPPHNFTGSEADSWADGAPEHNMSDWFSKTCMAMLTLRYKNHIKPGSFYSLTGSQWFCSKEEKKFQKILLEGAELVGFM